MFANLKKRRARKAKVRQLQMTISSTYESELKTAKTPQERGEASQIAYSICQWEENQVAYLRQEDIIQKLRNAPFEVPPDYWNDDGWGYEKVLTSKGEAWARHELEKLWRAKIEFWFKLVLPVLALILSIVALVRKSR